MTKAPVTLPELARTVDALYAEFAEASAQRTPDDVTADMDGPVRMIMGLRATTPLDVVTKAKAAAVFCSHWEDDKAFSNLPERLAWDLITAVLEVGGAAEPWTDDNEPPPPEEPPQADPAIAAVTPNRAAMAARSTSSSPETGPAMEVYEQAWRNWVTTAPTTLEGIKASLQHAKVRLFASGDATMMAGGAAPSWPSGGGEMASRVRDFDWAKTPLGPIEAWPQSLKTVVDLALSATQPMFVAAGADLICIYNDHYLPILGERHPAMLGIPFTVAFAEIWEQLYLLVADTLKGNSHLVVDQSFALPWRPDQPQSWFTYSYTPFRNEQGSVSGFLVVVTETTARLLAERKLREDEERQAFLLKLSDTLIPIANPFVVQRQASRVLREHLGAGRVVYYETSDDEEVVSALAEDVADDVPSVLGQHFRWVDFAVSGGSEMLRQGHSTGQDDVQAEDSIGPEQKAAFAATCTRAFMLSPLMKSGRLVACLTADFNVPHRWTPAEIRLLEETAERTWAAVERVRAEAP